MKSSSMQKKHAIFLKEQKQLIRKEDNFLSSHTNILINYSIIFVFIYFQQLTKTFFLVIFPRFLSFPIDLT